ncbi:MAG TPA: choice-of-anchor Q domain-containing protein [Pyrinomonadaceae bacterium]|nr:choice-of-anchor Q domain-containing protein [Pyrinomonadaceae bacterium]
MVIAHLLAKYFLVAALSIVAVDYVSAQIIIVPATGRLFTVNDTSDSSDAVPGDLSCADADGRCTLRAAIQEVNAAPEVRRDVINFVLPQQAVIDLTQGELSVTARFVTVVGPGARRLTIRRSSAASNFRIFNLAGGQNLYVIRGLTIANGSGGSEPGGGAIRVGSGANLTLTEATVTGNGAANGGGIFNEGTMEITRSVFAGNSAAGQGSGIFFGQGGAIFNAPGSHVRISNTTITSNSGVVGGAIYNHGTLTLANDTVSHNSTSASAAAIHNTPSGTVNPINTIIAANGSATITALSGSFTSFGNNLVTDARNSSGFVNGVMNDKVSNNDAIDAGLGPLADNGGPTDTRALLTGSPAIDAGNGCVFNGQCNLPQTSPPGAPLRLMSDQRREFLRQGLSFGGSGSAVDIGAFEAGAPMFASSASFGNFGFPRPGRLVGTAVFISAATGEKSYRPINPFGAFKFQTAEGDGIYVLDYNTKRIPKPAPQVIDLRLF